MRRGRRRRCCCCFGGLASVVVVGDGDELVEEGVVDDVVVVVIVRGSSSSSNRSGSRSSGGCCCFSRRRRFHQGRACLAPASGARFSLVIGIVVAVSVFLRILGLFRPLRCRSLGVCSASSSSSRGRAPFRRRRRSPPCASCSSSPSPSAVAAALLLRPYRGRRRGIRREVRDGGQQRPAEVEDVVGRGDGFAVRVFFFKGVILGVEVEKKTKS